MPEFHQHRDHPFTTRFLKVIAVPTMKFARSLLSAAAVVTLVGCGAASATVSTSPTPTSAPSLSPVPSPTPDLGGARAAALKIIVPLPGASGVWGGCTQLGSDFVACPFAAALIARLNELSGSGYFGDGPPSGVCGEDYITGTQNGLFAAPQLLSTTVNPDGTVSVVIQRGSAVRNLTATLSLDGSAWLASDLASGSGPSASIFSAKPNC
jgi:hypothetical protein